jgi:HEAT repeat protein
MLPFLSLLAGHCLAADKTVGLARHIEQQKLIGILTGGAPTAEKAAACKRLAMIGDGAAVPALAALLPSEELCSWARIALEAIPGTAADEALRKATANVRGRQLVGVINSLGVRRDKNAIRLLSGLLESSDRDAAAAAAVALGHIGGEAAEAVLWLAFDHWPKDLRPAVAEAMILCAERHMTAGDATVAAQIYDKVARADLPQQLVLTATRGTILARGAAGVPLLVEQLRSSDKHRFNLGLSMAREIRGKEATAAIVAEVSKAPPERQALLILALADRGDASVAPLVVKAVRSGSDAVRAQAIRALARLDESVTAPVLLDAALDLSPELSQAAMEVIDAMRTDAVNRLIADRLPSANGHARLVLLGLVGQRQVAAAMPILWEFTGPKFEPAVRAGALRALGGTITFADLPRLISPLASVETAPEAGAILQALKDALPRMPDREACAAKIAAAIPDNAVAMQCKLLEVLKSLGGAKALAVVATAAHDSDERLRDTGFKLLGQWMSVDAAPALLDLAQSTKSDDYKVRALRAYIRLARQFDMPSEQRLEMCRTAMKVAQRPDEKRLVLEILLRYPSDQMLALALEAAKVPELKDEAALVAMGISRARGGDTKELRKVLAQAGHQTVDLEIVRAEYGEGRQIKNVTASLRKYAGKYRVIFLPSPSYNEAFGGDPAPNRVKRLKVNYRINGQPGEISLNEDATVVLPMPK